tara:strand:+ start:2720 stop:2941 length:222 start_codon:yes stop_codon:yes gene_type:complete
MYLRLIVHLKNILIGKESMVRPNMHKKAYLTGPYELYMFFNHVWLKIMGNTNKYPKTKINPTDSLNKILLGVS